MNALEGDVGACGLGELHPRKLGVPRQRLEEETGELADWGPDDQK